MHVLQRGTGCASSYKPSHLHISTEVTATSVICRLLVMLTLKTFFLISIIFPFAHPVYVEKYNVNNSTKKG